MVFKKENITLTEEHKMHISENAKRNPNYGMKGKKHSKETIEKMKLARLGKINSKSRNNKISLTRKKLINNGEIVVIVLSGENSPNWKGGITALNKKLRTSSLWKIWRESVFLRDNFTCQNKNCKFCKNKIGVLLHPHHKKPVSLFPKLVFNIENGITYCEEFHLKSGLHKGLKIKNRRIKC